MASVQGSEIYRFFFLSRKRYLEANCGASNLKRRSLIGEVIAFTSFPIRDWERRSRKFVVPAKAGIRFEIEKAVFGFPLEFIPCFIRDGNDKLRHYRRLDSLSLFSDI